MPQDETKQKITKSQQLEAAIVFSDPVSDELSFTNAIFAQCSLPVNKPKSKFWKVMHGKVGLSITAGVGQDLEQLDVPYGAYARVAFSHIHNQIIRASSLDTACQVDLGDSMRAFFRENDIEYGGRQGKTLRSQLLNISRANISLGYFEDDVQHIIDIPKISNKVDFWLEKNENQLTLWNPEMYVNPEYVKLVRKHKIPLDMRAIVALLDEGRGAARAIDVYQWLTYRLPLIQNKPKGVFIPFEGVNGLHSVFGSEIKEHRKFKQQFVETLKRVIKVYPTARITLEEKGIRLFSSPPSVPSSVSSAKSLFFKK